jgi:hypothetical protein
MIEINIKFNCGCGEQFKSLEEAAAHVGKTGHTINVCNVLIKKK